LVDALKTKVSLVEEENAHFRGEYSKLARKYVDLEEQLRV